MTNNSNNPVLLKNLYPLEEDLNFFYGDLKAYSRNEIFRMIANKFQVLKDPNLIAVYMESIISHQGEKYSLVSREKPSESLIDFFEDLRKAVLKIAPDKSERWYYWRIDLSEVLFALKNSAYFFAHGEYLEDDEHHPKSDQLVKHYINLLRGRDKAKELSSDDQILGVTEAARRLGCSRQTMYDVHFKNGLERVYPNGPTGHQKIMRTELNRYMDEMNQKRK